MVSAKEDRLRFTCPMFTINTYNNGTVMVQGCENCLDNFLNNFQKMKEKAEKKVKESSTYSVADGTNKMESFTISSNPSVTLSLLSPPQDSPTI